MLDLRIVTVIKLSLLLGFTVVGGKEIEENNRMGKTRDLFKKIREPREYFMQRWAR